MTRARIDPQTTTPLRMACAALSHAAHLAAHRIIAHHTAAKFYVTTRCTLARRAPAQQHTPCTHAASTANKRRFCQFPEKITFVGNFEPSDTLQQDVREANESFGQKALHRFTSSIRWRIENISFLCTREGRTEPITRDERANKRKKCHVLAKNPFVGRCRRKRTQLRDARDQGH